MKRALYPGSFDPPTYGHLDVMSRSAALFDEVIVGIAVNLEKSPLFSVEERKALFAPHAAQFPNVRIESFDRLVVDFASCLDCSTVIRGIRTVTDFEYEYAMALANRRLGGFETLFMPASAEYAFLSSRLIKEAGRFGGDISSFVPENVALAFQAKLDGEQSGAE